MLSRRGFVGWSGLSLLGAGVVSCRTPGAVAGADDATALPPAIAALEAPADVPAPIGADEHRARIERGRALMGEHGIDALLLTGGTSMVYFTGVRWGLSERLFSIVLLRSGRAFVVTPAFEKDRTIEQLADGPLHDDADVLTWEEHEDPYALLAAGLRERSIATGTLGVEETVRDVFGRGVAAAAPGLDLVSGTPVTAGCRTRKDAHEIALMRTASAVTLRAYRAVYESIEEGMARDEVGALIRAAHRRQGYEGGAMVLVDASTALPHGTVQPQTIREGSIILVDGGCAVEGYRSDISRTFVLGRATDKMKRVFEIELRAQTAALAAARPGVECQAVDAAARQVIEAAGYGPGYTCFTHRVGHGLGMDGHEWPYLVKGNTLPLAPGMTFSDEPGIYLRGEFGIRLEDDMVVTADAAELLTPQSPALEDPFGNAG
jgi:Xaa-Pro dipeptidase